MSARVDEAVRAFAAGEIVVVVDDDDRENEGDLILAASHATPEKIAFIVRYTTGIVCAQLPAKCQDRGDTQRTVAWATQEAVPVDPNVPVAGIDPAGWTEAAKVAFQSGQIHQAVDYTQMVNNGDAQAARDDILKFDVQQIQQAAKATTG